MNQSDHLPQPATETSRAVWAGVMNRGVRERWEREANALWEDYCEDRQRLIELTYAIMMRSMEVRDDRRSE